MNEETPQEKKPAAEYLKFLDVVKAHGARASILVTQGEKQVIEDWNLKQGATDITPVSEDNLVNYRPLTRRERRRIFGKKIPGSV